MSPNSNELDTFREALNDAIKEAAEPLIKKALADIERTMRNRVAEIAVGMVRGEILISRNQQMLTIQIVDKGKQ